jgi:hypothetical protein
LWQCPVKDHRRIIGHILKFQQFAKGFVELSALSDVRTKNPTMLESFVSRIFKAREAYNDDLPSGNIDTRTQPEGPPSLFDLMALTANDIKQLRNRCLMMRHVLKGHTTGINTFRPQIRIPEPWHLDCDRTLVPGIVRLGCGSFPILWVAEPEVRTFEGLFESSKLPLVK